jgi:hypothetical protein
MPVVAEVGGGKPRRGRRWLSVTAGGSVLALVLLLVPVLRPVTVVAGGWVAEVGTVGLEPHERKHVTDRLLHADNQGPSFPVPFADGHHYQIDGQFHIRGVYLFDRLCYFGWFKGRRHRYPSRTQYQERLIVATQESATLVST